VVWGFITLIACPVWSLQQLTTVMAGDRQTYQRVWRFSMGLSVTLAALTALVAFTPLYGMVMGKVYNLSSELQAVARPAVQILVLYSVLVGVQSVYRGALIRCGHTRAVRTAMVINLGVLVGSLLAGVALRGITGAVLAAIATLTSNLVEVAWLHHERPSFSADDRRESDARCW
jgi:Na+-driven multidrug efflux pump